MTAANGGIEMVGGTEMSETRAMPTMWRRTATPEMERNQWL